MLRYIPFLERWQMPETDYERVLDTHTPIGIHPLTKAIALIADKDRYSGTYILGTAGNGKSYLAENVALHDISQGRAVFFIDPHGDSIYHVIARMPEEAIRRTYLFDPRDTLYHFGLPLFSSKHSADKVFHAFEVSWGESLGQQFLPNYLRACLHVLASNPGSTLLDMPRLLTSSTERAKKLALMGDKSILDFWQQHEELSKSEQNQRIAPLINRLNSWFMGRASIRGILGQAHPTFDPRLSIGESEIILMSSPLKTDKQDAKLIGSLFIGLVHGAIFSFEDTPESKRPGLSLFIDEFEHFCSEDIAELISEGRKFGMRICLSHQYRAQVPPKIQLAAESCATKICFRTTHDDAAHMGHYFLHGQSRVKPEDMDDRPVERLLHMDIPDVNTAAFIDIYVRNYKTHKEGNMVVIKKGKSSFDAPKLVADDPMPYLDHLLLLTMKQANATLPIPEEVVLGLSNGGRGFYGAWRYLWRKRSWLEDTIDFPDHLVIGTGLSARFSREVESDKEELYRFFFLLRQTMLYLSLHPLGKASHMTPGEAALGLTSLPKRAAWVRSGDTMGVIYTDTADNAVDAQELQERLDIIREQTRAKYCSLASQTDTTPPEEDDEPPTSLWEEDE